MDNSLKVPESDQLPELSAEDVAQCFEALRHQQSRNDPPSSRLVPGYNVPGPVGNVSSDTGENIPLMIQLQSQTRQKRHPFQARHLQQAHSAQGVSTQAGQFAATGVSFQQTHSLHKSHIPPGYSSSLQECSGQQGHSSHDASTDGSSNRSRSNPDQTGHSSSLSPAITNIETHMLLQSGQQRQQCEVCGHEPTKMQRDPCICEMCRYFFQHTVSNKNQFKPCSQQFECNLTNREGTCTYCRYMKCLEMGIKPQLNHRDVPEFLAIAEIVTEAHMRHFTLRLVSPAILLSISGNSAQNELAVHKRWANMMQALTDMPKDNLNLLLEAAYVYLIIAGISYRSTGTFTKTIMFANGCVVHQYALASWGARGVEYVHGFDTVKKISDKMATLKVTREEMGCLRAILFFSHGAFFETTNPDLYVHVKQLYTRCYEALQLLSHPEPKRHESLMGLIQNIIDAGVKWFKYLATHREERALLNKLAPELLHTLVLMPGMKLFNTKQCS